MCPARRDAEDAVARFGFIFVDFVVVANHQDARSMPTIRTTSEMFDGGAIVATIAAAIGIPLILRSLTLLNELLLAQILIISPF